MKTITLTLLCLGILALACGPLAAQDVKLSPQVAVHQRSLIVQDADAPPAGLVKLFSNLGPKGDTYDDTQGYLVEGPTNPVTGDYQWIADPFTPKKNSTVTEIEIALAYEGDGTNNAEVALYSDVKGLPGKALESWNVKNLPAADTCCKLVKVTSKKGIKIKKGKQYWVLGLTDKASTTAYDGWDFVYNDAVGPIAFIGTATNGVWTSYTAGPTQAFAVYGTTP
jgi:hypothetical protein